MRVRRAETSRTIECDRRQILRHRWDLVIVDEPYKVKNHNSARFKFRQQAERNYILLLTATPLQKDLRELYKLVTFLCREQLGTWCEFRNIRHARRRAATE